MFHRVKAGLMKVSVNPGLSQQKMGELLLGKGARNSIWDVQCVYLKKTEKQDRMEKEKRGKAGRTKNSDFFVTYY